MPIANQRNFAGVLQGLKDGVVTLETEKGSSRSRLKKSKRPAWCPSSKKFGGLQV
jgi:ribosomal protein L19E